MKKTGNASFLPLLAMLLVAAPLLPAAQDTTTASVTAGVSSEKIGLDDTLIYTLTFANIENPVQPDLSHLDDFRTLQTSRSSELQFSDGASTSSTRFSYYLMPTRTGRLTLPPVVYSHQGREYRTSSFTVEVVKGSLVPGSAPQAGPPAAFGDDFFNSPFQDRQPQKVDAYLRAVLSKPSCVKGEQLLFRVLLYTRNRIEAVNMLSSPSFAGFWQEWFPTPPSIAAGSENVNGVIYQVYEIRKAALFASDGGTLVIPSLQFELEMADPRSAFFGTQALRRSTQEIKVKVSEPPAAAAGLPVGQFSFSLRCPQKKADINEIVTLQMEISGSGNSKAVIPPTVAGGEQALVYPAKITQEAAYSPAALTGTLRAEIPVSFQRSGTVTFPPQEFRYFDPARGIVTLRSSPVSIQVSGEKLPADLARTLPRSAIVQKGEDIDFIKDGPLHDRSRLLYRQKWYAPLILALFAANLLVLLKRTVWDRRVAPSPLLRNRRILACALRRLAAARSAGDIAPALESYICDKSGLGPAEINDRKVAEVLRRFQVPEACIDKFLFIKGQSDLARFSQQKKSALELKKDLQTLRGLLKLIDGKMK
jgi:hypothetical protein